MDFKDLQKKAFELRDEYRNYTDKNGEKRWGYTERLQGLIGDVGDLTKLVMAKNGYRSYDDLDGKIEHELVDCLWAIIVLADELNVDLEKAFIQNMEELKDKLNN